MQGVLQQGQKQQKFNSSGNHLQQSIRKHMLDAQCPLNWLQQDSSNELARENIQWFIPVSETASYWLFGAKARKETDFF